MVCSRSRKHYYAIWGSDRDDKDGACLQLEVGGKGIRFGNSGYDKDYPSWFISNKNTIMWSESRSCAPGKVRFHFVGGAVDLRPLDNLPERELENAKIKTYHIRTFKTIPTVWLKKMRAALMADPPKCEDVPTAHMGKAAWWDKLLQDPHGDKRDQDDEMLFQIANVTVGGKCGDEPLSTEEPLPDKAFFEEPKVNRGGGSAGGVPSSFSIRWSDAACAGGNYPGARDFLLLGHSK